jgi:adenylate kinase family enzyme
VEHYEKASLVHRISAVPPPPIVFQQVRKAFTTDVVVLLGAAGSGRGEFIMRAGRALGYAPIRVTALLQAEAADTDSPYAADIKLALATKRTAPVEATIAVVRRAMAQSTAKRFILDGYPRVVSVGYPRVSDQVFALEEAVGPIKGAVLLETDDSARSQRVAGGGDMSVGELSVLRASIDTFHREKVPVAEYFDRLHKLVPISTAQGPAAVFDAALPFLEADPVVSAKQGRTTAAGAAGQAQ